ncbi:PREDICTED: small glutamine-rich tetratricopeptide repeat-containing protein beta-like [Nicrophorus vespilloides]|uniref:Small glutamine-rich tetratricopeptide repeat-containing protein beta-like n=1 Tax=Nicrophorus vespilloides TaxID=110193 RepID=A0ABM1M9E6_NICVS|nr:PREDICTED: small glutamine-rich tetratricopeptide repeat-containing protein beta-like [Nicrophorus vespilloides]
MSSSDDFGCLRPDEVLQECLKSILKLLKDEMSSEKLDSDQKESLGVAKQCLESCYSLEDADLANAVSLVNAFNELTYPPVKNVLDLAESLKTKGNEAMKDGNYSLALDCYTKAIEVDCKRAVYFCNRAAAYSKLDRHQEAIDDCKEAIKLDSKYGKAYGRLGIAYANLNMFQDAANAYKDALRLDPSNASYEANLKLAETKIVSSSYGEGFDYNALLDDPAVLSMASQMISDPSFLNVVSGIMSSGAGGDPNIGAFLAVGQQFAERMQSHSPGIMENLRQSFSSLGQGDNHTNSTQNKEQEKKD